MMTRIFTCAGCEQEYPHAVALAEHTKTCEAYQDFMAYADVCDYCQELLAQEAHALTVPRTICICPICDEEIPMGSYHPAANECYWCGEPVVTGPGVTACARYQETVHTVCHDVVNCPHPDCQDS